MNKLRLLFEIGMEENPARFLVKALDDLKKNLENIFFKAEVL